MKNLILLALSLLLPLGAAQAQHMGPDPVVPGSKGDLPEMPVLEKAGEGHFGGLKLQYTTLSPFQGSNWSYEVELGFPTPESLGGTNYTLERYYSVEGWASVFSEPLTGGGCVVGGNGARYRLVLHGGEKDGWVSNEVQVPYLQLACQKKYSQTSMNQSTFVGSQVRGSSLTIYTYHDIHNLSNYTAYTDDSSFNRTWYRRNPNTCEMTSTNCHDYIYTVANEDIGYEIVEVVTGDGVKTDFYFSQTFGVGRFPVYCSAEYFYDGFIVNTEYVLPSAREVMGFNIYDAELGMSVLTPFAPENFRELVPGRYAITCPWAEYGWQYLYSIGQLFEFCEKNGAPTPQPLYLWCAPGELEASVLKDGQPVEGGKINVLQLGMDGHMQYAYSTTDNFLMAPAYITHYAKAVGVGEGYLPTYFPNALLWTDAQSFNLMEMSMSEEGPYPINIEVRRDFAPLDGGCTVEGHVEGTVPEPSPLVSFNDGASDIFGTWILYMTDEDGNPIHTEEMLRIKLTINEDGTFVMSIPVWGEVQSGNWSWWNTGTTIQFRVTKIIGRDGTFEGDELVEYMGGDPDSDRLKFRTDIRFDTKGNLIMDIFGLEDSMFEPEGGVEPNPEDELDPVYVYLRQQGGDIVAAAPLQADGSYSFKKVPFGTYEVIPNIDGYDVEIQSVTLSSTQSTASGVDFVIGDYVIYIPTMVRTIYTADEGSDAYYDLTGRRVANPAHGIYIHNGKKQIVR